MRHGVARTADLQLAAGLQLAELEGSWRACWGRREERERRARAERPRLQESSKMSDQQVRDYGNEDEVADGEHPEEMNRCKWRKRVEDVEGERWKVRQGNIACM